MIEIKLNILGAKNKGFTLVELIMVVAIIGILAMIAVPSYQGFVAKARQKEGFALLQAYYMAAHSTRAEFGHFPGNFVQTGFQPVGELWHRLRSNDGRDIPIPINDDACTRTGDSACDCGGQCIGFVTWTEAAPGNSSQRGIGYPDFGWESCAVVPGGPFMSDDSFRVGVAGWIRIGSISPHRSFINERKVMDICSDGLN
jgi:prepilin-type N-terminal cleavage/methylation domain-containing protein